MSIHGQDDQIRELTARAAIDSQMWFPELHSRAKTSRLLHMAMGLGEEAGEVLGVIKKWNRKPKPTLATLDKDALGAELADTLIYLMHIADLAGIDLSREFWRKREINVGRFGR